METTLVFIFGILSGLLSGVIPGVGGFVLMTMAYPFLLHLDPVNILIFYVTMASIDQYFNGITAIVFGVPGASMNIPTQIEGHTLFRQGKGSNAIMFSAVGSYFASMFAVLLVVALLPVLWGVYGIWTSMMQSILLGLASLVLIYISRNKLLLSIIMFAVGGILGQVGYREETGQAFMTFGIDKLYSGLPTLAVLVSLFVVPVLIKSYMKHPGSFDFPGVTFKGYIQVVKGLKSYWKTLIRSSFLGSLGGLMPGMSFGFSSLLAYTTEKALRKSKNQYKIGDMNSLVACESANNAGVFTQLIPLLFLGIPITASEALIYNVLETRGLPVDIVWFKSTFNQILVFFILSSFIGLLLSAKYVNLLKIFNGISINKIYAMVFALLLVALWQTGLSQYAGFDHLLIAMALMPFGMLLYRHDTTPLLFGFLLSEPLIDNLKRVLVIYF
tara:strand:- start:2459 stop:3787 length:1329 start_codon:yes stop_codon:yes gene_type:complete